MRESLTLLKKGAGAGLWLFGRCVGEREVFLLISHRVNFTEALNLVSRIGRRLFAGVYLMG